MDFTGDVSVMEFDLKNLRTDGKGMIVDSVGFQQRGYFVASQGG